MKKVLIGSYFVGMLLLTYVSAKAVAVYKNDKVEVTFQNHENTLSDTEISQRGILPKEGKKVVEMWQTKETRTKTLFGWETEIEYVKEPGAYYVDCGC